MFDMKANRPRKKSARSARRQRSRAESKPSVSPVETPVSTGYGYRETIDSAANVIFTLTREGVFTSFNAPLGPAAGWSAEEWMGKEVFSLIHPDDLPAALSIVPRLLAGETPPPVVLRVLSKSGSYIPAQVVMIPQTQDGSVIGSLGIVRNMTKRKGVQGALEETEKLAVRLSAENAALAEIGRILSSTLDTESVYGEFAAEVRKLIPLDRITISLNDPDRKRLTHSYVWGCDLPDKRKGSAIPFAGSVNEHLVRHRSGVITFLRAEDEILRTFPNYLPNFRAGIRSAIAIPLIVSNEVIGGLSLQSFKADAYTDQDLAFAERIGSQISGAVSNSILYAKNKEAEESLGRSERMYRLLVETASEAICVVQDGSVKYSNPALARNLGYTAEEFQQISFLDLLHPDDRERAKQNYLRRLRGEDFPPANPVRGVRKEGTVLWAFMNAARIDWEGRPAVLCFFNDVTEMKLAEERLRASEERFRSLIETTNDLVWEDDENRRLTYVSPRVREILGYEPGEMIGRTLRDFMAPEQKESFSAYQAELVRRHAPFERFEQTLFRKDGGRVILEVSGAPYYDERGRLRGYRGISRDITERKRVQKTLERSEKEAKWLAEENAVLARLGQILSSTLDLEEVFERFAREALWLVPFDWVTIDLNDPENRAIRILCVEGPEIPGKKPGDFVPFKGSVDEHLAERGESVLFQLKEGDPLLQRFPTLFDNYRAGVRSQMSVPLVSRGEVIGGLHILSVEENVYTEGTLRVAEKVGLQISGAVANAELHARVKKSEEAARKSEERYRVLSEHADEGICVLVEGKAKYTNPKLLEYGGYAADELGSRSFLDFIHPEDRKMVAENHLQRLRGEHLPHVYSFRALRKDGAVIHLNTSGVRIDWEGRPATLNFLTDVTGQRLAEERLKVSEERFRGLVESTSDLVWEEDEEAVFTYVNPRVREMLGYEPGEVVGKKVYEFMSPEDGESFIKKAQEIGNQKRAFFSSEEALLHKNGSRVTVESSGIPFFDGEGRFRGYRGISRDITERKQTEARLGEYREHLESLVDQRAAELRKTNERLKSEIDEHRRTEDMLIRSEKRYRGILETTLEGVCLADREGKVYFANDRMLTMMRSRPEDFLGQSLLDFVDEISLAEAVRGLERSREGSKEQFDLLLRRKNGPTLWTLVSSSPMLDDRGEFASTLLMVTDISERKEIEEKIHRSKIMLQKFFDGISEPLIMIDQELRVMMLNVAARDYYGAQWSEIIGTPCNGLFLEGGPFKESDLRKVFTEGHDFEFERKSPRNPHRFEKLTVYPLKEEGQEVMNAVIRLRDITEETVLQKQLMQNERLAALGLLVSGIAHEISNPNSFITFNLPVLRDFLEEIIPVVDVHAQKCPGYEVAGIPYRDFREDLFRLLDNVQHGSDRINNTVSNLKEFSNPDGKQQVRWVHPKVVIEKAVTICGGELNKKVKRLELEVDETAPAIHTDSGALEHVLVNLLVNACQCMDKADSWVRVKASSGTGKDHFVLEVSDNGSGMDEGTMERIFEPFFTTKKPGVGTGLGLYVSRNLVERLGGDLIVRSEIGKGSTFRITLPQLDAGPTEGPASREKEDQKGRRP